MTSLDCVAQQAVLKVTPPLTRTKGPGLCPLDGLVCKLASSTPSRGSREIPSSKSNLRRYRKDSSAPTKTRHKSRVAGTVSCQLSAIGRSPTWWVNPPPSRHRHLAHPDQRHAPWLCQRRSSEGDNTATLTLNHMCSIPSTGLVPRQFHAARDLCIVGFFYLPTWNSAKQTPHLGDPFPHASRLHLRGQPVSLDTSTTFE
jgi:hypothetical protein